MSIDNQRDDTPVHVHHCCEKWCKYGEADTCPVVNKKHEGLYQCEDCNCIRFNPTAHKKAEDWWANASESLKVAVYLDYNQ